MISRAVASQAGAERDRNDRSRPETSGGAAADGSISDDNMKKMNAYIERKQNPVRILAKIIME